MKKLVVLLLSLVMAFSMLVGCGKSEGVEQKNTQLVFKFYDGGYGDEWGDIVADNFQSSTGIMTYAEADANLLSTYLIDLQDDIADSDVYISHGIDWKYLAVNGYIEPINDVYAMEVASGVTVEDCFSAEFLEDCKYNGNYYKLPYTQGASGIAYNTTIMEENNWEIPSTYSELITLCDKIVSANLSAPSNNVSSIAPFVWPGSSEWFWDYIVMEWWGQLEGIDGINDILTYEMGVDTWSAETGGGLEHLKEAFELWAELIVDNAKYSLTGSDGISEAECQNLFATGNAVMMPATQWSYNESSKSLADNVVMELHPAPTVDDAVDGNVNFMVGYGDSMFISANSENKDNAKKFLVEMCKQTSFDAFAENSNGAFLATNYNGVDSFADVADTDKGKIYALSVNEMLQNSKAMTIYSNANVANQFGSEKVQPWINNTYYYKSFYSGTLTIDDIFDSIYDTAEIQWALWSRDL